MLPPRNAPFQKLLSRNTTQPLCIRQIICAVSGRETDSAKWRREFSTLFCHFFSPSEASIRLYLSCICLSISAFLSQTYISEVNRHPDVQVQRPVAVVVGGGWDCDHKKRWIRCWGSQIPAPTASPPTHIDYKTAANSWTSAKKERLILISSILFPFFLWGVRIKRCTQKQTTVFEYPLPPFRHPVKLATLLFGGILNSRDAWSGIMCPSGIPTPLYLHNLWMIPFKSCRYPLRIFFSGTLDKTWCGTCTPIWYAPSCLFGLPYTSTHLSAAISLNALIVSAWWVFV